MIGDEVRTPAAANVPKRVLDAFSPRPKTCRASLRLTSSLTSHRRFGCRAPGAMPSFARLDASATTTAAPRVTSQRLALPFSGFALGSGQPGARHRDLDRSERAGQRLRSATVAVACNAASFFIAGHPASSVTRPCQRRIQFGAKQPFNELTRSSPHFGLKRIKPVVEKIPGHIGRWMHRIRLRGNACHGVVSSPTLQRRMIRG